uniref:Receptor expression-enhancing protein n=1 Tax=Chaetoceros debilis TaxID=122233 RepID=A0A7S3PV75_9STRA|eukprot:CAMPEP_0194094426 /NCGR_PEP_ID=MMETSP0149-20130528/54011_1 /TAXON_ID=122233 /ORGANISM="Chaetoceros debilis, Strain MM31A-1" /LENGTH=170 /DNA_ID=CAMNT_0038780073 /DNA_START=63 /DNA_END=575 /DNA_ORIENTATION=+
MPLPPQVINAIEKVDMFMAKYPTLTQYEKLKDIEKQTGHSKVYFFALAVSILSSALYALGGGKLCTDLVTFIYPAYMSFKAIDSANSSEHTQWLTYWVVYSFFSITESVAGFLTEFIPFYFIIKICFFVYLYHPKFMGAGLVYTQAIKPFVMPHLEALTKSVSSTTKKIE